MKRIARIIITYLIECIYYIYDNETNRKFKSYKDKIFSIWLNFEFKNIGKDVTFNTPISLIGGKYISIGNNVSFRKLCIITAHDKYYDQKFNPKITIGDNCCFGQYNHITAINEIEIGNGVLTGSWVTITDNSHGETDYESLIIPPAKRKLYSKGKVIIEDNVWIGDKATILPGVHIGKGAIIATNSVVTKNVPSYSVIAGNPGIIIKILN